MRAETSVSDSLSLLGAQPCSQAASPMGNGVSTGLDLAPSPSLWNLFGRGNWWQCPNSYSGRRPAG